MNALRVTFPARSPALTGRVRGAAAGACAIRGDRRTA